MHTDPEPAPPIEPTPPLAPPEREGLIQRIIGFSAHNRFLVLILTAVAILAAIWCVRNAPLDAIPDLSDTQVIVFSRWDRSPDIIEDQVTYPIVTSLLGSPKVKAIRGFSDYGFSYVYVIFEDGTDIYWARSRVLERLEKITPQLPQGVQTELGPDASGVGWVYQYGLVDKSKKHTLTELRSFQDWFLRYQLQSVPGVAEVASLGGWEKQYQITVDPDKLIEYNLSIMDVVGAIRKGNQEAGGGILKFSGAEYMVRGRGYATSEVDLGNIALGKDIAGRPVYVRHVGLVEIVPDERRGVSDLNGQGDIVSGTIVMRHGENAMNVIRAVKKRMHELEPSLPEGVEFIELYDRSDLIRRAIDTLKHQLVEEMIVVSIVILIFLWHIPSAIVPIVTIPVAVLLAFIPFYLMGHTINIMSLSGIAISIGVLVDGAIIEVENAYKRLEQWIEGGRKGDYHAVRLAALKEVGPSVFFSLLVIAVAFIPIFTLIDQEGRLFKPLAWAKNWTMFIAAGLAITLDPALRMLFTRMNPVHRGGPLLSKAATAVLVGKYYPEEKHPVSKILFRLYEPACRWVLRRRKTTIGLALVAVLLTVPVYLRLGSEFMPPLWEGSVLYMPTTMPGISDHEAEKILQTQDQILKEKFPSEVEHVFGKAGRIESSTDPAPLSMMETVIILKPEKEWRKAHRWYSALPEWMQRPLRNFWPDRISREKLIEQMDRELKIPGTSNAWTMPIKNRIDMLSTGMRTPIGVKILGPDLDVIESIGVRVEAALNGLKDTRSVYAERTSGGYFVDFDMKRDEIARHGLSVDDVQTVIMSSIGGEKITSTVEGRERYPVVVRYPVALRNDIDKLKSVLVMMPGGAAIPMAQLADIHIRSGPGMIRNENGMLAGYVYVDTSNSDIGGYVKRAKELVRNEVNLPQGYALIWSGQYENMQRVTERLKIAVPLTIFLICLLLYMNTRSAVKMGIVLLAVPFSLIGAVWLLHILGYNISIAVWVGMIALMGLDAETGIFMLLFLDISYDDAVRKGRMRDRKDLEDAIVHGAVKRVRPKMMTVTAAFCGLLPIMWSTGAGSDMMKRVAAPMIGGLVTSFILELLVYPPIYAIWKSRIKPYLVK